MFKETKRLLSIFISAVLLLGYVMPMTAFAASTQTESILFPTATSSGTLITKAVNAGLVSQASAVKSVSFVDLNNYNLTGVTTADYSSNSNNSVLAWYDSKKSALYIGGYGKIKASYSLSGAFYGGTAINEINGLDLLDTSGVLDMSQMFAGCGQSSTTFTLDLGSNFDTSNVTNMRYMFDSCGQYDKAFTLSLGDNFDTSKVRYMSYMFQSCGKNSETFTLDLGDKFDTSKVTEMEQMFCYCGTNSKKFALDLGDNFNTSNVTTMSNMFNSCGANSTNFALNLGNKFDTSKVTDMSAMFAKCGAESTGFTLNLGSNFNTSNVTIMSSMFSSCGKNSTVFTLDLGDKFNTSKVTEMISMFAQCGQNSQNFTLDLGGLFDTSKVKKMNNMFSGCGQNGERFTLDLGDKFNTSIVTTMEGMFYGCGANSKIFTLDLGDLFDTAKVIYMKNMFAGCGAASETFTLDLGDNFNTSRVAEMQGMFGSCGFNSPVFTLNLGSQFNTSAVKNMQGMFAECGYNSSAFKLDLGDNFKTSNVTNMSNMFYGCGGQAENFTELDLSGFTISAECDLEDFACEIPVTSFKFGEGWTNAALPESDVFAALKDTETSITGATSNLLDYDWAGDKRTVQFTDKNYYKITAEADVKAGGTVSGGATVMEGKSVSLTATANDGYTFEGWYDGDTKVCDTAVFTIDSVTESKTYTAKFTKDAVYYTITAVAGTSGGSVSGGGTVEEGGSITLTATARYGYNFEGWYDGDTKVCDTAKFVVENVSKDKTYTAKFTVAKEKYTITSAYQEGGIAEGGGEVEEGDTITIRAIPDEGYVFDGWYFGSTKVCDTEVFVIENITSSGLYIAKFKKIVYYTVSASAGAGGSVSGGGSVLEGASTTLIATANDGYTFAGWYDGETKVCDTATFVVTGVSEDKTYTAKFTESAASAFDFTSLRTLRTQEITVDHQTKTINLVAADGEEFVTIFVYQKDIIPGGTFRMASYMGNKVVYDPNGSYRVYFVSNFTVPVKANITINGVTEQYLVNVIFDSSEAKFDFTSLKGENFSDVTVDHDNKTIQVTADSGVDDIILYVNQHNTIYGGKLRMASYLGNKVKYDASGVYTIYANGKNSVSVKANITINGVVEQYLITVDFPGITWGFDDVKAENVQNMSIDHTNKVVTIDTTENADSILLYIDQICQSSIKGQIWMKSYMGNKVVYNASDRTYTIPKMGKSTIKVQTKITMLGETRYYDVVINFTESN